MKIFKDPAISLHRHHCRISITVCFISSYNLVVNHTKFLLEERKHISISIFNKALLQGKAQVTRMQPTVIGEVAVAKISLVRNLSGEDFLEERSETHGINTSMVEMTELDYSWHVADLT